MRYRVSVRFSSDSMIQVENDEIRLSVKSSPEHGRANRELVETLANFFKVDKSHISIVSGHKSRHKVIDVIKD